ncbi:FtsW/RodA/SpoVE family cell cycle protein [Thermosulfurimonas sp. F29]|uniref:FtsW/RodA/SpoVE family cell cycle protein n=1 Tax=Thermosulfurimonas sp. F29 TaxID=2867247 RepID=UPI001C838279|nr:FtsW/RodA/SpoVE family cell cycle protein [Thermosulfurimonas sp. F29]MBX6422674.1 FtsW/RodA/SpoVE family cell cycle protein [Thermosulfurimonas sp. F29]
MRIKIWLVEWPFFLALFGLFACGLLNQYSAGGWSHFVRQALFMGTGVVVFLGLYFVDYRRLLTWPRIFSIYMMYVLLLLYMAVSGKRWLVFGGFSVQPSEFAKPLLVALLALFFAHQHEPRLRFPLFVLANLLIGVPMVLIAVTDLDQAFLLFLIGESLIFMAGLSRRLILAIAVAGLALSLMVGPPFWRHLKPYQRARILAFLKPGKTQKKWSYQTRQALIAVGSGGLLGQGFRKGLSSRLHYLPAKHTDLAFAVWAEEWGFVGSILVLALYALLVFYALKAGYLARDPLGRFLAFGAAMGLFWQVFVNLGGVLHILPAASLPLPFLSYGGSSILSTLIMLGMVASVMRRRFSFL